MSPSKSLDEQTTQKAEGEGRINVKAERFNPILISANSTYLSIEECVLTFGLTIVFVRNRGS